MATTKVTMKLEGFETLQRNITRAPERIKAFSTDAVKVTAFAVAQRMRATVRRRTGFLQSSIDTVSTGLTGRVVIQPSAYYWRFLEYGSIHNKPATPFIRPAAEAETPAFIARVRDIGDKLERDWSSGRLL